MPDYKEMYLKLIRATEEAIRRRESNPRRFLTADLCPCGVKALGNTKVFPVGFSLPGRKSARQKLLCTPRGGVFEGFSARRRQPC